MNRAQRGHALYVLLLAMAAVGVAAGVVTQRTLVTLRDDARAESRAQALWLARSAALNGSPGRRSVTVDGRKAEVVVSRQRGATRAEVTLDGYVASVTTTPGRADGASAAWDERYVREGQGGTQQK